MRKENKFVSFTAVGIGLALLLSVAGCAVISTSEDSDSKDKKTAGKQEKNVEITTPLGGLKVRKEVDLKALGLTPYPNARLLSNEGKPDGDNHGNVSISTPFFGLKVIAVKYESDDASEKIVDFYKKDMERYGKVLPCKGPGHGTHVESKDDDFTLKLNCDDVDGGSRSTTLKAGEGSSQHLVVVEPQDKGTQVSLIYIQMRGKAETM